jgi:hypothetical protein
MSQYKITKKRLAQIIKEEYDAAMLRTDEGHGAFGIANRDEDTPKSKKKKKEADADLDEAHCGSANRDEPKLKNPKKADLDKDGKLSKYEKKRGKAIEKSMKKESLDSIRTLIQQELKNL